LADQPLLHGPVASTATAWRVLDAVDETRLAVLRSARAVARERAWLARAELTGVWTGALNIRREMSPRSAVPVLDRLLANGREK
jgi:hypothetical protein